VTGPSVNHQRLHTERLVVLGMCGHWWQIERAQLGQLGAIEIGQCPTCHELVMPVVLAWIELYPDPGLGPGGFRLEDVS